MIDWFRGKYSFLSNFYKAPVVFDDVLYPSVENAYQAAKTLDINVREYFVNCTAVDAKRSKVILRPDWDLVKVSIMYDLVYQKFFRHIDLRNQLLSTGNIELIEGNYWGDTFWGICRGKGDNYLGRILMQVRSEMMKLAGE